MRMGKIRREVGAFQEELEALKRHHPPDDFSWYPYGTMGNVYILNDLLAGELDDLFSRIDGPILDLGAGDGDLAFFFESLGHTVEIIDYPPTNWNGMQGAYRLRDMLGSRVAIHEMDVDTSFDLPRQRYGLAMVLGILYHLKNPFRILEALATRSRYLILSTRIARETKSEKGAYGRLLEDLPVAYLLGPTECNNDATNYWIFSARGLERLLHRTGWRILNTLRLGDTNCSNPSDPNHDERMFVVLESSRFVEPEG